MREIVRTTRTVQVNNRNEGAAETLPRREVARVGLEQADMRSYDENRALQQWVWPMNAQQRELALLREFDFRLAKSEERNRRASYSASFELAGFWLFWGILMLILGSALMIVLVLILTSLVH